MKKELNQEKVFDQSRKLFEFDNEYKFLVVACNEKDAEKFLVEECKEEGIEEMSVREVARGEHFEILDEDDGNSIDIWNMIDRDAADENIKVPYMAASTIS